MSIKDKIAEIIKDVKDEGKVLQGEKSKDKVYMSSRVVADEQEARSQFQLSKRKLFDVNKWSSIPGFANATFELYEGRTPVKRDVVQLNDFIRIDLPGPLPQYWVKVTDIDEGDDFGEFTVQPSYDPTDVDDKMATDHFFQNKARSIFRTERNGTEIIAMEIGIDEAINNKEGEAGGKGLVNTLVSEGGWALFQKYQWKNLTKHLVGDPERTPEEA